MTGIYLLLGSNLGKKASFLAGARNLISEYIGPINLKSSLYFTEPWGMSNAPAFLNQVLWVKTSLMPHQALKQMLDIESGLGRKRTELNQDRTLDIDLLYFGDQIINDKNLTIPHPRISERMFVLKPLVEIAPDFIHPLFKLTNQQLLEKCTDPLLVSIIN